MIITPRYIVTLTIVLLVEYATSFQLSSMIPSEFKKDAELNVLVTRLNSINTHIPYEFYYLNLCKPQDIQYEYDNIGDRITGDRQVSTPYKV